ncbi:DNA-J chaperone, putative [Bodo saltans]|uniref:DNA-J chaperone, putative n=1 Tax=Bodo saltans TaxID=75058 RepID=A0A0S4J306_BODSA|nr:DNA-J chaperone, putative [Bodo saltans]|eukprot:CUG62628.1 DNA-J chaperone, putative [Bodo saltans]
MGLDDIDEDPVPTVQRDARSLDDLFGGLGVTVRVVNTQKTQVAPSVQQASDPLDSLFGPSPCVPATATFQPQPKNDLFDFTRPVEVKVHRDGNTLLDLFESGGKTKVENRSTLSAVATPSTSRVAAHFLNLMNYYDVLSVSRNADVDEIKRQYKKKALELHPDKAGASQTTEEAALFKMVTKAYETLCDDTKRREYDSQLQSEGQTGNWLHHV